MLSRTLPLLLALAGCDFGVVVGCDFRADSVNGPEPRCQERSGLSSAIFGEFCEALEGEQVKGGCPEPELIVAGCDIGAQGDGTRVIDWFYPPTTRDEVVADCADEGTVVDP